MSDWKIEAASGESVLVHSDATGRSIDSERADIEAAERAANSAGRTLVFVRLFTDTGMSYYYPLQFVGRLTEAQSLAVGPGCGFAMWTDPEYKQKRTLLASDAEVDYADGTVPLRVGS